jgi:hypothetical protein
MNKKTKTIYKSIRDEFDRQVVNLTAAEYKEVLDELAAHIECCQNCWDEENAENP